MYNFFCTEFKYRNNNYHFNVLQQLFKLAARCYSGSDFAKPHMAALLSGPFRIYCRVSRSFHVGFLLNEALPELEFHKIQFR